MLLEGSLLQESPLAFRLHREASFLARGSLVTVTCIGVDLKRVKVTMLIKEPCLLEAPMLLEVPLAARGCLALQL